MPQESNTSCDMVKKPLTLDEAIAHVEEEVAGNPDTPFKREHRQLAEWLRELRKRRDDAVGDAAKLRKACEALMSDVGGYLTDGLEIVWCGISGETIKKVRDALSSPPRNCDVPLSDNDFENKLEAIKQLIVKIDLTKCEPTPWSTTVSNYTDYCGETTGYTTLVNGNGEKFISTDRESNYEVEIDGWFHEGDFYIAAQAVNAIAEIQKILGVKGANNADK